MLPVHIHTVVWYLPLPMHCTHPHARELLTFGCLDLYSLAELLSYVNISYDIEVTIYITVNKYIRYVPRVTTCNSKGQIPYNATIITSWRKGAVFPTKYYLEGDGFQLGHYCM